jgi:nucleoside-diphosphate-sugar epimerase
MRGRSASLHALANEKTMAGRPFNAGRDDANLSKEKLALKIKAHIPSFFIHFAAIGEDPDKRNYIVSNQRLKDAGFAAKRSIDQGIIELLKGYQMLPRSTFSNV